MFKLLDFKLFIINKILKLKQLFGVLIFLIIMVFWRFSIFVYVFGIWV